MINYLKKIVLSYISVKLKKSNDGKHIFEDLMQRYNSKNALDYITNHMQHGTYFNDWKEMFNYVSTKIEDGLIAEFGVAKGKTINYLAKLTNKKIYGFDSFEGFPPGEDYIGWQQSNDAFNYKGVMPPVEQNVTLIKGYYSDTLEKFISENTIENIDFIHIDCDLYSSTKFVLDKLKPFMNNTYIQFDEFHGEWAHELHEKKAFHDFLNENENIHCEYIGFSWRQILVRLYK